ncbi:hypothetical protein LMG16407_00505 [Pandoraea apista]|nr:hypothetical protein AT395_24840 [Pandoraea apista]CFB60466.1 hypothetical protein LMG16407_00505 [Pandoraea apista]
MNSVILRFGRFWGRWTFIAWSMPVVLLGFGVWAGADVNEVLPPALPSLAIALFVTVVWIRFRALKRKEIEGR